MRVCLKVSESVHIPGLSIRCQLAAVKPDCSFTYSGSKFAVNILPKSMAANRAASCATSKTAMMDLTKLSISCQLLPPGGSLSRILPELSITNAISATHAATSATVMSENVDFIYRDMII